MNKDKNLHFSLPGPVPGLQTLQRSRYFTQASRARSLPMLLMHHFYEKYQEYQWNLKLFAYDTSIKLSFRLPSKVLQTMHENAKNWIEALFQKS